LIIAWARQSNEEKIRFHPKCATRFSNPSPVPTPTATSVAGTKFGANTIILRHGLGAASARQRLKEASHAIGDASSGKFETSLIFPQKFCVDVTTGVVNFSFRWC
jgi:hypothetical protein